MQTEPQATQQGAGTCLNCGKEATLRFCPHCGQSTREPRASVAALLSETFGTLFNLDSRVMRSIKPLFLQPGMLTRFFIQGRRMTYVPPVRLYLVCSLGFFLSLSYITTEAAKKTDKSVVLNESGGGVNVNFADPEFAKKRMEQKQAAREALAVAEEVGVPLPPNIITGDRVIGDTTDAPESTDASADAETGTGAGDAPAEDAAAQPPPEGFWAGVEHRIETNVKKFEGRPAAEVLTTILPQLFKAMSNGLVLLMPVFALFLKLLYVRRDPYYVDHLIFALHFHSFLFLFFSGLLWWNYLVDAGQGAASGWAVFLLSPFYLYKSMRRVYGQGRLKTVGKFVLLCAMYGFSMMLLMGFTVLAAMLMV